MAVPCQDLFISQACQQPTPQKQAYTQLKQNIKNELVLVNDQILNMRQKILLQPTRKVSMEHYLGCKHLGILRSFKKIITAQTQNGDMMQMTIKRKKLVRSPSPETNRKRMRTLCLMSTLENLKADLLRVNKKNVKTKSKSLNKLNITPQKQMYGETLFETTLFEQNTLLNSQSGSTKLLDYLKQRDDKRKAKFFLEVIRDYKSHVKKRVEDLKCRVDAKHEGPERIVDYDIVRLTKSQAYSNQWKYVAIGLDRRLFITFIVVVTISIIILYSRAVFYI